MPWCGILWDEVGRKPGLILSLPNDPLGLISLLSNQAYRSSLPPKGRLRDAPFRVKGGPLGMIVHPQTPDDFNVHDS